MLNAPMLPIHKISISGAGGYECDKTEATLKGSSFILDVDGATFRFNVSKDGDIMISLINGTHCEITADNKGYPAIKLMDLFHATQSE